MSKYNCKETAEKDSTVSPSNSCDFNVFLPPSTPTQPKTSHRGPKLFMQRRKLKRLEKDTMLIPEKQKSQILRKIKPWSILDPNINLIQSNNTTLQIPSDKVESEMEHTSSSFEMLTPPANHTISQLTDAQRAQSSINRQIAIEKLKRKHSANITPPNTNNIKLKTSSLWHENDDVHLDEKRNQNEQFYTISPLNQQSHQKGTYDSFNETRASSYDFKPQFPNVYDMIFSQEDIAQREHALQWLRSRQNIANTMQHQLPLKIIPKENSELSIQNKNSSQIINDEPKIKARSIRQKWLSENSPSGKYIIVFKYPL